MRLSHDAETRESKGRGIGPAFVIDDIEIARALHVVFVVLLAAGIVTIFGAVAGAHGGVFG